MPIRPLPHSPLAISTPHGFKPPVLSFPACSITTTWRCILHVHPPPRTTPHHTTPQQHRKKLILILRALAPFTYCSFCPIHVPPAAAAAAAPVAPAAGMACRGFLQCLLKLFNFALAIVGVLLIVYSLSRLIHLDPDLHPPNPPSPSPSPSPSSLSSSSCLAPVPMHLSSPLPDATQLVSGSSSSSSSSSASSLGGRRQLGASSNELRLPNLWPILPCVLALPFLPSATLPLLPPFESPAFPHLRIPPPLSSSPILLSPSPLPRFPLLPRPLPLSPSPALPPTPPLAPRPPPGRFIYVLVGGGALLTLVTIVGAVAAESNNGCCLSCVRHCAAALLAAFSASLAACVMVYAACVMLSLVCPPTIKCFFVFFHCLRDVCASSFPTAPGRPQYQFGLCVLLLIQGSLAALVWLQDVPEDPTGEYERERAFVLRNLDLCRLAAVSLLLVE
ncbi:unnamed protein product, partial [Closterium sp. NIES-54]